MTAKEIIEVVKNGAGELARDESSAGPAPSDNAMSKFFSEISSELKYQAEAGAHEMASALFRGDAFVMYGGREGAEQAQEQGNAQEQAQDVKPWEQEKAQEPSREQDRGMEMEM